MNTLKLYVKRNAYNELTIYDGNGIELPLIKDIVINSPAGEVPTMTVTFLLLNESIIIDSKNCDNEKA